MKNFFQYIFIICFFAGGQLLVSAYRPIDEVAVRFPYKEAGLTKQQAAAHLLSRFSFGATPGQVEEVAKMGLEKWFLTQLSASDPDEQLTQKLDEFPSLKMSNREIVQNYPRNGQLIRMAIAEGIIDKDSAMADKKEAKEKLKAYMETKGLKPQAALLKELVSQKILRAAYSNNQLKEVLTDFWFNHFNVAVAKGDVSQFVTSYERDAIRPNVLGKFGDLLIATAKSPAMLVYLDNNKSTVNEANMEATQKKIITNWKIRRPKMQGLNENYAREIMELHTLGVDGGYTQEDVTEAARVLTGWGLNPKLEYNFNNKKVIDAERFERIGFVHDDNFLFSPQKHDREEKKVLKQEFPAGGGYEEGIRLLQLLANNRSTAAFISKKIAIRFVNDSPPISLIDKMIKTFLSKDGNIKEVLLTMVSSPEFWSKESLRQKTKSPFELIMSTLRNTSAEVDRPFQLYQWMNKMGQKLYNYQAPTGFPDRGQYWINTGSLLNRMNYGLAVASGRIPGVSLNLLALNNNHEPESAVAALKTYSAILMPERNTDETVKRLTPLLNDPSLTQKINAAATKNATAEIDEEPVPAVTKNNMLTQVVGIILGSPEYQRR